MTITEHEKERAERVATFTAWHIRMSDDYDTFIASRKRTKAQMIERPDEYPECLHPDIPSYTEWLERVILQDLELCHGGPRSCQ